MKNFEVLKRNESVRMQKDSRWPSKRINATANIPTKSRIKAQYR